MTVSETASASSTPAGRPPWIRLSGTIQEVIDELQNQNVSAGQIVYYADGGTNAVAVFCRMK